MKKVANISKKGTFNNHIFFFLIFSKHMQFQTLLINAILNEQIFVFNTIYWHSGHRGSLLASSGPKATISTNLRM